MVHRDIKPHNLMLTRKGQIKILDFGLARMASETRPDLRLPSGTAHPGLTRTGEIMGTPDYMAPEQFIDPSRADIRADLYSLASTLYYLLTGRTPLADYPVPSLLNARKYRSPRPITELRTVPPDKIDPPETIESVACPACPASSKMNFAGASK